MVVVVPMLCLLFFLATGMPIAFAMIISGAIGLIAIGGWELFLGVVQTGPFESVASFEFSTIPLFILMAEFLTASNITKDIFYASNKWLGRLPGGLGIATIIAGAGLGAMSGSSTASAATLSASAVPEMKKYNYKTHFAMGVVSIAGTLAFLIPPSIVLIVYGIMTETSISKLLISGIIPGIITALGYIVTIVLWVRKNPAVAPKVNEKPSMTEKLRSLKYLWPMIIIILLVIGGIYSGAVTAVEAGGLGAIATLSIGLIMRRLKYKQIEEATRKALKSSVMILTIIIGATIFGRYLTASQITQNIINLVSDTDLSKWVVLSIIVIIYLILGVFMDQTAILLLTLPLTFPLLMSYDFNAIWLGIIITKTAEIGMVTPPVGMNVFVASGAANESPSVAFKGVTPFVITDLIILVILIIFPFLSTWLPAVMTN